MKLDVLLSAMFLENPSYIDSLNITGNCVVINQCNKDEIQEIMEDTRKIKFISTTERGLSRSRNMAIKNSDAEICILCDNDVEYISGYDRIIIEAFERNPQCDILCFYIKRLARPKPLFTVAKMMNSHTVGKVGSPQIAFRKKSIGGMKFKELLGAGSKYSMGEESVFLQECLSKGLKVKYIPEKIADLRDEESTWFKGFTPKYFRDRGACIYETSNHNMNVCHIKVILFAFLVKIKHDKCVSIMDAIKSMEDGIKSYQIDLKEVE